MTRVGLAGILTVSAFLLSACGGGGGSKSFTSFAAVKPGEKVTARGSVNYALYTTNLNTGATTAGPTQSTDAQATFELDNNSDLTYLDIVAIQASVKWDPSRGDQFGQVSPQIVSAISSDGQVIGLIADPAGLGFNYQTFGAWITGYDTGRGVVAVGSFGAPSFAAPNFSTATYIGAASGFALDAGQTPYLVLSDAQIDVDFAANTFAFLTNNSIVDNLIDAVPLTFMSDPGYDLSGNGNIIRSSPAGKNIINTSLAGNVSAIKDISGTINGKFFGPNVEEVGGIFDLTGPDGRYSGSFGAVEN